MAKAKTVFLNQQEMNLIHAQSLKSLLEIGIKVHSKSVDQDYLKSEQSKVNHNMLLYFFQKNLKDIEMAYLRSPYQPFVK